MSYTAGNQPGNFSNIIRLIWNEFRSIVSGTTNSVDTIANLQALDTSLFSNNSAIVLTDPNIGGIFYWNSSNLSSQVTADTQNGIYVPPNSDTTGASGAWVRLETDTINTLDYGAAATGLVDDIIPLNAIVAAQQTIDLLEGTYLVSNNVDLSYVTNITFKGKTQETWTSIPYGQVIKPNTTLTYGIKFIPTGSRVNANITIKDIFIDADTGKLGTGVRFDNYSVLNLTRVMVAGSPTSYGINLGDTNSSFGTEIDTCYVNNAATAAFRINARNTFMRFCRSDGGLYGVDIGSVGGQSEIIGCHIEGASTDIIRITSAATNRIIGNNITAPSSASTAVYINGTGATFNTIVANIMSPVGTGSIGIDFTVTNNIATSNVITGETGVKLQTNQSAIVGNQINATTTALTESTPGGGNVIVGNVIAGGSFSVSNDETVVLGNYGAYDQKRKYAATLSSGDTNDYGPSTFSSIWFLAGDAAGTSAITGIAGGIRGREITIVNVSAYTITIKYANTGSVAANRILDVSLADIAIPQYGSVKLEYDATTSRWYVVNKHIT